MGDFAIPDQPGDCVEGAKQDLDILSFILVLLTVRKHIFRQKGVTLIILYGGIGVDGA